jgi:2-polyprenyl-3-methyl-5-hydroxy-6-metoxy-1,4-benzoquinol methylase
VTNTTAWDRLAATPRSAPRLDTVGYGPEMPSERELRLLGEVKGKRVLDLGCGAGQASIALALQGAHAIALDASAPQLAQARRLAEAQEVRVEWHCGDLADLAFLRADSIDLVFSSHALVSARHSSSRTSTRSPSAPGATRAARARCLWVSWRCVAPTSNARR